MFEIDNDVNKLLEKSVTELMYLINHGGDLIPEQFIKCKELLFTCFTFTCFQSVVL